jgi:acyl-coenzyme A thioesterase PaaI-like protein
MTAKDDSADDRRIQAIAADQPPFAKLMGLNLIEVSRDRVVAEIVVREELTNRNGGLHGGAVMGIADNMGGTATFVNMPPGAGTTRSRTRATSSPRCQPATPSGRNARHSIAGAPPWSGRPASSAATAGSPRSSSRPSSSPHRAAEGAKPDHGANLALGPGTGGGNGVRKPRGSGWCP